MAEGRPKLMACHRREERINPWQIVDWPPVVEFDQLEAAITASENDCAEVELVGSLRVFTMEQPYISPLAVGK